MPARNPLHCILPPDVLERLARTAEGTTRDAALDTLSLDRRFRLARAESAARNGGFENRAVTFARIGGTPQRTVYDQKHSQTQTPGSVVRGEGQPAVAD